MFSLVLSNLILASRKQDFIRIRINQNMYSKKRPLHIYSSTIGAKSLDDFKNHILHNMP